MIRSVQDLSMTPHHLLCAFAAMLSAALLQACSKSPDEAALNASVQQYWQECSVVKPGPVTVLSHKADVVRFSYVARLTKGGAAVKPSECAQKNSAVLQAAANVDFRKMPSGSNVVMTMDQDLKTGSMTVVMQGPAF